MGNAGQGRDVVFLSGKRTGFGTFGGSLKDLTATELGVHAARAALVASGVAAEDVVHCYFGNALQTSSDAIYLARHVALRSGVPEEAGAVTVNRLCGSGFEAIVQGAKDILLGEATAVLCGGSESMSTAPHAVRGARAGAAFAWERRAASSRTCSGKPCWTATAGSPWRRLPRSWLNVIM